MPESSETVREVLLQENEEFQRLAQKHEELEERLTFLSGKIFLSDEEKLEEVTLKKKKLALKDKMAALIRNHESKRAGGPGEARPAPA
ncbi:MAG: DUF465 domain-containing protein [Vicinamibacteria bacterium]